MGGKGGEGGESGGGEGGEGGGRWQWLGQPEAWHALVGSLDVRGRRERHLQATLLAYSTGVGEGLADGLDIGGL